MIACILTIILFVAWIIGCVAHKIYWLEDDIREIRADYCTYSQYTDEKIVLSLMPLFIIIISVIPWIIGYYGPRGKDAIVYRLQKGDINSIRDAQRYNSELASVDNYFFRFTLHDPDDYIDIEAYYKEASK